MQKFSLNGTWNMSGGGYNCDGAVPGSVYSFLLDKNLMPDPYYRTNELEALDILENDFDFSRKFDFTVPQDNSPVLLHCDGLDTLCDIFINGNQIAHTDNMHRCYEFDITNTLKDGENEIKLTFLSPNKFLREMHAKDPMPGCNDALYGTPHLRKASCMFGWDWGPRLPDAGIWKDIYLLTVDSDRIDEIHITQRHTNGKVYVTPTVKTEKNIAAININVISPCGCEFNLPANTESEITDAKLWWPNGFGEQNLYTFNVTLVENGKTVDCDTKRIGLRDLKLVREKDKYGETFCHEINGLRFFAMGADYIPEDNIMSRYSKERTYKLIKQCRDCNFNAIRVWGGGIYPHDYFFDACDEYGIIVFNDLMFACMAIPDNQSLIDSIAIEVRENLMRIRHHASIAVISGNNEIEDCAGGWNPQKQAFWKRVYIKLFERIIPKIVEEVCQYIPYVPSSPSSGGGFVDVNSENYGDCHYWRVWHGGLPFTEYRKHYFRYLSEFGFESFPCEKTVNSFTLPKERNIFSRTFEMHQRCKGANKLILNYLGDTFRYPTEFGTLLYASQLLQAEAIRYAVEHLRRNRNENRCMGALYWQLNDIWPVASWASIDYYGRYKALQYVAKRFFAPIMISCEEIGETTTRPYVVMQKDHDYSTKARLCVTNETTCDVSGTVKWELRSADAKILQCGENDVTVNAFSSLWLDNMDFNKTDVENNYLSFAFIVEGAVVSEGSVLFTVPKHFDFINPNLRYEINGDEITVFAEKYAKSVEIYSPDSDFILSDNYFDMNAGSKTVKILEGEPKTIQLRSVYDIR